MICNGCGSQEARRVRVFESGLEICDRCGEIKAGTGFADVYFDGKPEINLADDPVTGKPIVFSSRGEKARYLKEKGLCEAGDRVGGAPFSSLRQPTKTGGRHEAMMALKQVRDMGRDVRRQAYLKIIKENQRHAEKA